MNSDTTVNTLHTLVVLLASAGTAAGLSIPSAQLDDAYKGVIALGGIGALIASWITSHFHHRATAQVAPPNAAPAAAKTPAPVAAAAASAVLLLACGIFSLLTQGCATIDPPLPGQTNAAPFIAFTNGTAYLLGHAATSNEVYTFTRTGTELGVSALLRSDPGATNYLDDAQVVLQSMANAGVYNPAELANALHQLPLQNANDQPLIDALGAAVLGLGGSYVSPLIDSNTNSGPFIKAALHGIADGL